MKKLISLILTIGLALSLCACGGSGGSGDAFVNTPVQQEKPDMNILGEWVAVGNEEQTVTFLEDGTCTFTGTPAPIMEGMIVEFEFDGTVISNNLEDTASYEYTIDEDKATVTIHKGVEVLLAIAADNGKTILTNWDGEHAYVRREDFEYYHAIYNAQEYERQQAAIEEFIAYGKQGRIELELGKTYAVTKAINLTVDDCYTSEVADENGLYACYFAITVENIGKDRLCLSSGHTRLEDGEFKIIDCDLPIKFIPMTVSKPTSGVIFINPSAMDCELFDNPDGTNNIESGDLLDTKYLEPDQQSVYYCKVQDLDLAKLGQEPGYTIFTCGDVEFYVDLAELVL